MIFAIDPTMKRLVATISRGDRIAEFDASPIPAGTRPAGV
jgi:hypothetical protein